VSEVSVGVPAERWEADKGTGAGRVWTTVLDILRRRGVRIRPIDTHRRARLRRLRPTPDVWLTPGDSGLLSVAEPVVTVLHGAAWPIEKSFFDYVPRAFADSVITATEATLSTASLVIVPSNYTRRGLLEGYAMDSDSVCVVPHGVDAQTFSPAARGGRELVAGVLGTYLPYVLFASIPSIQQKNLAALRVALGGLAARGLPHALAIAGGVAGGESPEELAAIVEDLPGTSGRVAWLGHVDDEQLSGLMAECAAFCLPSFFESFGLTALEAMASGAPVVLSDRGALPEVGGDAALSVEPTAVALEAALGRVLTDQDLASTLRARGRARAEAMTWERTADGWHAALQRAAGRDSKGGDGQLSESGAGVADC